MYRNHQRKPWEADLAAREARTPEEAADRAHRGAALARAALAGDPLPALAAPLDPESRLAGYENVACVGCYRPVYGLPGSRCDACSPPPNRGPR